MRQLLLVTATFAAFSLSACSTMKELGNKITGKDNAPAAAKAESTDTAAPAPEVNASATEEKEMSALMGSADNPDGVPAVPVESVTSDDGSAPAVASSAAPSTPPPANAPKDCPAVEVLPDTKSITYFDDPEGKPNGEMIARASLTDIKGGCDYSKDGVIVDIDMIMQGKISDKGRYEGRKDLEAFMTFPYFVAVMDPTGKMVDKKIMATAMRFKPQIDDLDHAEKITQTIPMSDISQGPKYTITLGFQLNRAQLDYNRGGARGGDAPAKTSKPAKSKKSDDKKPAETKNPDVTPAASSSAPAADASKPSSTGTAATPAPAPAATAPEASKMKPVVE